MFLGIDGRATRTAYALVDARGRIRASHVGESVSHVSEGLERAGALLSGGITATLQQAGLRPADLVYAFVGLAAYGEDSQVTPKLDSLPARVLDPERYRCGNDVVCSWAGSLGCTDGISVISGTGSVAYGEYEGRSARAGGWGEIIGDEGSAYWIAREGMNLFSRMSDGRAPRGPLHRIVRKQLGIRADLDLCARIRGEDAEERNTFPQLAPLVYEAAKAGDKLAQAIFQRAADELVLCAQAVRRALAVPEFVRLPVSHSGGVLAGAELLMKAFKSGLEKADPPFDYRAPRYPPAVGAAAHAARLAGKPLKPGALNTLRLESDAASLPR
jgi:N-acetylglucosamine kinase-like BadF-type ATPase